MAKKKLAVVAAAGVIIAALVAWWSGDEPADEPSAGKRQDSTRGLEPRQREPAHLAPRQGAGFAQQAPFPEPVYDGYPPAGWGQAQGYPGPYGTVDGRDRGPSYRFRPLTDREKQRMEPAYPGYAARAPGGFESQPPTYQAGAPEYPSWQTPGYSFRPPESSRPPAGAAPAVGARGLGRNRTGPTERARAPPMAAHPGRRPGARRPPSVTPESTVTATTAIPPASLVGCRISLVPCRTANR